MPKIEIVDVEGGRSSYEENEMKDASAQHLLRFPSINLHSITKKMLILKNCMLAQFASFIITLVIFLYYIFLLNFLYCGQLDKQFVSLYLHFVYEFK